MSAREDGLRPIRHGAEGGEREACGAPWTCGPTGEWAKWCRAAVPERFAAAIVLIEAGQRDRSWAAVAPAEALDPVSRRRHRARSSLPF